MNLIGVDIGGSHISAAQVEIHDRKAEFVNFQEADVDTFGDEGGIISAWSDLIKKAIGEKEDYSLGIAMPGPYDYEAGVSLIKDQGKMASLYQKSVKNLLAESLGISPSQIAFTNDAEAFLAGECFAGAGRDFQHSIGITLGTGLGSAIKVEDVVKDAKLWTAPFRDGIAEDYISTSWFTGEAKKRFGIQISGVKDLFGRDFDAKNRHELFIDFGRSLGEFLFPYLIRLHSEGVVIGGKISLAAGSFLPETHAYLDTMGYPIPIKTAELGERAALIGACLPFI